MRRLSASEASSLIKRSIITIMCVTILIYIMMIVQVAHFAARGTVHLPERDVPNVSITRNQHSTFTNGIHWEQAVIDDNVFGISDPFDDENGDGMSSNESPTTNTTSSPDSTEDPLTIESQEAEQMTGIPGDVADTSVDQLRAPDLPSAEADPLTRKESPASDISPGAPPSAFFVPHVPGYPSPQGYFLPPVARNVPQHGYFIPPIVGNRAQQGYFVPPMSGNVGSQGYVLVGDSPAKGYVGPLLAGNPASQNLISPVLQWTGHDTQQFSPVIQSNVHPQVQFNTVSNGNVNSQMQLNQIAHSNIDPRIQLNPVQQNNFDPQVQLNPVQQSNIDTLAQLNPAQKGNFNPHVQLNPVQQSNINPQVQLNSFQQSNIDPQVQLNSFQQSNIDPQVMFNPAPQSNIDAHELLDPVAHRNTEFQYDGMLPDAASMGKTKPEYVAVPNMVSTKTRPGQTATEEDRDTGSREMLPDEDGFIADDMEDDIPQLNQTRSSLAISTENVAMEKRLPDCLIIGARKGGTRALNKFLNLNPLVRSLGYEVQYFNLMENYAKGEHWYIDQMPLARADQVVVEKSAEYFHVMEVPERVSKMKKDMKLIIVLRDPFQRMVSDYNFIRRYSRKHPGEYNFPEMKHSLENLVVDNTTGKMKFIHGGLHRSEYIKFFRNWLKFFPKNQLLILNGDSFASENPALELQKAEKFLGIKSYITEDMFYKDETKGFYCPKKTGCFADEKGHRLQQFDAKFEKTVRKYFRYYTKQLNEELGLNFNWD